MTLVRLALAGVVGACAVAAWPQRDTVVDTHRATRQFVIHSTIARLNDPIVVLGDSIVEASTLPRTLCGRPVVNAGIGGLSTATALSSRMTATLGEKTAALIVVSLGTNDAAIPDSVETFLSNYRALLADLRGRATHLAVAKIPPVEVGQDQAKKVDVALIDGYNAALPALARATSATLIDLPAMPPRHTFDGVHLNASGYEVWEKAIANGIAKAICGPASAADGGSPAAIDPLK